MTHIIRKSSGITAIYYVHMQRENKQQLKLSENTIFKRYKASSVQELDMMS